MVWDKSKLTSKCWEEILWHLVGFYESYNILSWTKQLVYSGFPLQGDRNWCHSSIFYLTASLIHGGYLLVNFLKSIFKPGAPGFLKLILCGLSVCVLACVCVCPRLRLLITSGMIWSPYDWLNKFYSCCMAIVVVIINGRGLSIDTRHGS